MLNLYDILLTENYYNQLIEEGKDPVELLKQKFPQWGEYVDKIVQIDPTKKKSYTFWLFKVLNAEHDKPFILNHWKTIQKLFDFAKEHNDFQLQTFTCYEDAEEAMQMFAKENDYDVLYDTPEWTVYQPHTYEADRYLGRYTDWCTASDEGGYLNGRNMWNQYSNIGPIYINYDKRRTETRSCGKDANGEEVYKEMPVRSQFLFEYTDNDDLKIGMMCDSDDEDYGGRGEEIVDIFKIPDDVVEFYESLGYDFRELEVETAREKRNVEVNEFQTNTAIQVSKIQNPKIVLAYSFESILEENFDEERMERHLYNMSAEYGMVDGAEICDGEFTKDSIIDTCEKYSILKDEYYEDKYWVIVYSNTLKNGYSLHDCTQYDWDENYGFVLLNEDTIWVESYFGEAYISMGDLDTNMDPYKIKVLNGFPTDKLYFQLEGGGSLYTNFMLLAYDPTSKEIRTIIKENIPQNEMYFEYSQDGKIYCKHGSYTLNGFDYNNEYKFEIKSRLDKDIYLVKNQEGLVNIYSNGKLACDLWFNRMIEFEETTYDYFTFAMQLPNKKYCIVNSDIGLVINMEFDRVGGLFRGMCIVVKNGYYNVVRYDDTEFENLGFLCDIWSEDKPCLDNTTYLWYLDERKKLINVKSGKFVTDYFDELHREGDFQLLLSNDVSRQANKFELFNERKGALVTPMPIPYDQYRGFKVDRGYAKVFFTYFGDIQMCFESICPYLITVYDGAKPSQRTFAQVFKTAESIKREFKKKLNEINKRWF